MSKKCDFYTERFGNGICMIKDGSISNEVYQEYCRRDEMKKCPIYIYFEKNK